MGEHRWLAPARPAHPLSPKAHLLVAALDAALALPQVHHLALAVAEDLHLNVVAAPDVLLNKHLGRVGGVRGWMRVLK
jgi:hypothetical protein